MKFLIKVHLSNLLQSWFVNIKMFNEKMMKIRESVQKEVFYFSPMLWGFFFSIVSFNKYTYVFIVFVFNSNIFLPISLCIRIAYIYRLFIDLYLLIALEGNDTFSHQIHLMQCAHSFCSVNYHHYIAA